MHLQPREHIAGIAIRRKHWIEHLHDARRIDDQSKTLDQGLPGDHHGRQPHRGREREMRVRKHRKRNVQARDHLALIRRILRRQPEHMIRAGRFQVRMKVAKRTGLRRAAPRARDHVPVVGEADLAGLAGPRIRKQHDTAGQRRQIDR